ncbi:MAG: 1,4-dihydroxy-2-naphthoate octaprenyltransferase [Flavobacteriales bacterium]|jgi:1,4-dihydroxy-2-naphthoate octaprenyltransferase
MKKVTAWLEAMRLRTLPLAMASSITGAALAWKYSSNFTVVFLLVILTTILLQILSNLANDYGDFKKGTDNEDRIGPERAMQKKDISAFEMKRALIVVTVLTLISGISLLSVSFENILTNMWFWIMLAIGLGAIWAALSYTMGEKAYGYSGFGDIFVFLFFGLVGVLGSFFLFVQYFFVINLLPAAAIGLFATAVLNLNNMRDHKNDAACGKKTLVVKMGIENAKTYHAGLLLAGWACATGYFVHDFHNVVQLIIFIPAVLFVKNLKQVFDFEDEADLDPELKKIALGTFAFSILFFISQVLV